MDKFQLTIVIKNLVTEELKKNTTGHAYIVGFLVFFPLGAYIFYFIFFELSNNLENFISGIFLFLFFIVPPIYFFIHSIKNSLQLSMFFILKRILLINNYWKDIETKEGDFILIHTSILKIQKDLEKIRKYRKFPISEEVFTLTNKYLYLIITEIRARLSEKVEMQVQIIKNAYGELTKNTVLFSGNSTQFAELQKTRLEQQISQFEDLQKVLVKI